MRKIGKILGRVGLALLSLFAFVYAVDDVRARVRGKPVEHIKIGLYYAMVNRWNETEYSVGNPVTKTCVVALLPHFGYTPCWYLKRHTIQQVGP